jgi:drug/metabolite transporter (DMT)-like permease
MKLRTSTSHCWSCRRCLAGNAVIGRALVGHFPPLALSFWRWTLALAVLAPFAARAIWRERRVIAAHWPVIATVSLLGVACYNSLQYLALHLRQQSTRR